MFRRASFPRGEVVYIPVNVKGETWVLRVNSGVYEWVASLSEEPRDVLSSFNPFTIYAYKVRDPETGWDGWILVVYPRGCPESACAIYLHTEATDEDVLEWMKSIAEIAGLYHVDTERFYEALEEGDITILSGEDFERYELIKPSLRLASKILSRVGERVKLNLA